VVAPIPREKLLEELQRLARVLEKSPTAREMKKHGDYSVPPYFREFGSWNDALDAASLRANHDYNLGCQKLLDELSSLAGDLGYPPTKEDMDQFGRYSSNPYYRVFDSWNEALRASNLEVHYHRDASREDLLNEIRRLARKNTPPGRIQMANNGKYSPQAYYTRFGSWNSAVREAGFEPRRYAPGNRREYDYGDGWNESKREHVRTRDDRECKHCGMSEGHHRERFGERLHVHHLIPAEEFDLGEDRNDVRNLVSLCRLHHRTWEAADDYCPIDQSLPEGCRPEEIDPYLQ
jgi:hypothetical protein